MFSSELATVLTRAPAVGAAPEVSEPPFVIVVRSCRPSFSEADFAVSAVDEKEPETKCRHAGDCNPERRAGRGRAHDRPHRGARMAFQRHYTYH